VRILDVGSGGRPHSVATHLCDALEENLERGSDLKRDSRPFVYASIDCLPFRDESFDYLYAVHVLEHTANPAGALEELTRVARAGYVETPTPFAERMYGWKNHRCTVRWTGGRLEFGPKIEPQRRIDFHALYKRFLPWKAIHKTLDIAFGLLYVRIEFRHGDGKVVIKNLGRRQALYDLFHDPLTEGVGPPVR
jgi:SAM-dependent methyltransferase